MRRFAKHRTESSSAVLQVRFARRPLLMTVLRFSALAASLMTIMAPSAGQAQPRSNQTPSAATETQPRRVALGTRIKEPPIIDGVLDESIWQQAKPLTDFTQTEPGDG